MWSTMTKAFVSTLDFLNCNLLFHRYYIFLFFFAGEKLYFQFGDNENNLFPVDKKLLLGGKKKLFFREKFPLYSDL